MINKKKIKEKIQELETLRKELEALLEEPETNNDFKLKLNTGEWYYHGDGQIFKNESGPRLTRCFNSFETIEQIEIAVKRKSAQDELLQIAFTLNGNWKPDWRNYSEPKYSVNFNHDSNNFLWHRQFYFSSGLVYFKESFLPKFLATASDNLKSYIKGELQ